MLHKNNKKESKKKTYLYYLLKRQLLNAGENALEVEMSDESDMLFLEMIKVEYEIVYVKFYNERCGLIFDSNLTRIGPMFYTLRQKIFTS